MSVNLDSKQSTTPQLNSPSQTQSNRFEKLIKFILEGYEMEGKSCFEFCQKKVKQEGIDPFSPLFQQAMRGCQEECLFYKKFIEWDRRS